jgi:hypothetical protein
MRYLLVLIPVLLVGCSEVSTPPQPPPPGAVRADEPRDNADSGDFPPHFTVVFTREYGMWKYRACTLEISLFLNTNRATLECDTTDSARVNSNRELVDGEATRLRRLAQAADLYGPDHIGRDLTPTDGVFETLRFRPVAGGRAVVLVTSGNRSFVDHEARRQLLQLLNQIESDLAEKAGLRTR